MGLIVVTVSYKDIVYRNNGVLHIDGNVYVRYYFSGNVEILGFRKDTIVKSIFHGDFLYFFAEDRFRNIDSLLIKGDYVKIVDYGKDNKFLKYIKDHIVVLPFLVLLIFLKEKKKYILSIFSVFTLLLVFNTLFVKFRFAGFINVLIYLFNVFIVFSGLYYLFPRNKKEFYKRKKRDLIALFLGVFYGIAYIHLYISPDIMLRDMYHTGEVLMQWSFLNNGLPYKNVFIIHGLFQDPYQVSLGFLLFGKHISSYFIISTFMVIITSVLFIYLAWRVMDYYRFRWFIAVFFIYGFFSFIITDRILPILIFFILYTMRRDAMEYLIFVVFYGILYSIDVGGIMLLLYVLVVFMERKRIKWIKLSVSFLISSLIFLVLIKFQLVYFIKYVLYVVKYYGKEWFFPYSFPSLKNITIYTLLPIFVCGVGSLYIFRDIKSGNMDKIALLMYVSGFLFFYGAINRSDYSSVGGGVILLLMAFFMLIRNRDEVILWSVFVMFLLSIPSHSLYESIKGEMFYTGLRIIKSIKGIDDKVLLPDNYRKALEYIEDRGGGRSIYVLSSEGIWYYLLDTPPYSLYMVPVQSVSNGQQERVIKDIDYNKIKYIIYDKNSWFFEIEKKIMILNYVNRIYVADTTFGSIEIMKRIE